MKRIKKWHSFSVKKGLLWIGVISFFAFKNEIKSSDGLDQNTVDVLVVSDGYDAVRQNIINQLSQKIVELTFVLSDLRTEIRDLKIELRLLDKNEKKENCAELFFRLKGSLEGKEAFFKTKKNQLNALQMELATLQQP